MHTVGLIVGGGTGQEIAQVFRKTLTGLCDLLDLRVEIKECPHRARTYWEVHEWSIDHIQSVVREDVDTLMQFLNGFYGSGGRVVFRTAINAESLYQIRRIGKAVKTMLIPLGRFKILMVRDEICGFYSNDHYSVGPYRVDFSGSVSRDDLHSVLGLAAEEGRKRLGADFKTWVLYKHHLFANVMERWVKEKEPGARISQPDTGIHLLFGYLRNPETDLLLVTGNEIGDMLHEFLILHLGIGTKDLLYSRNMYLTPPLHGLIEYQTIHGSADDIAGRSCVNPLATMRAAGGIIEEEFGLSGFSSVMEQAARDALEAGFVTPDMGGAKSTAEVVDHMIGLISNKL
jgi:tartrate dehydrogenase/decarboxylase / D-malate dehydrogenase